MQYRTTCHLRLAVLGAAVMGAATASADLTVRVRVQNGAPRLLVNGKPVRPRMFFGGPGSNPIAVGPEGQRVTFDFTATGTAPGDGTMHFRFGQTPGDIYLDDVSVVDLASGREVFAPDAFDGGPQQFSQSWMVWPFDAANTVGKASPEAGCGVGGSAGLHVRLTAPPDGRWPDFHIYRVPNLRIELGRTYRVSLWCRAAPARQLSIGFYRPGTIFVHLGGPPGRYDSQVQLAAGAGVNFVSFVLPTPWPAPGEKPDWSAVDNECDRVLRNNPKALLLPRFGLDPPAWWAKAYPDDMMVWDDGSRRHTAVPASPLYRTDAAAAAAELVRHLEAKYGEHMAGYHPCGQNTGEWFYEATWEGQLNGYAKADALGFRAWLQGRYGADPALRAAWLDPQVSLSTVETPTPAMRRAAPNGVLRDPASERMLVDFAAYQQDAMADFICNVARAVRQASAGRKLVVFFYGYCYEFGGVVLGPATCGHFAMRRVLNSPDIDVLCSPISYGDRGLAETGPVMSAAESVPMAGAKMWLQEDDTRTHESPDEPDAIARLKTPSETANVLTRNVANEATRNMATWWMDLGMAGWFDDPGLWDLMKRLAPLDEPFRAAALPFRPEIASVLDERSMLLVAPWVHETTTPIIYSARHKLGRVGAPYGQYLQDDIAARKVAARMYVFHSAWWLDAKQRKDLMAATRGATRVWLYAPGAFDEHGPNPSAMQELTGFRLVRVTPATALATPTALGRRLGLTESVGIAKPVTPLFAAADAQPGEALATYPDGSVAIALRQHDGGWSLFVGAPGLSSGLLRIAARKAGVHLYTQDDSCVWANGPIVAVQATKDGPVTLRLRDTAEVSDALSGQRIATGSAVRLDMRRGDVRVLRIDKRSAKSRSRG